MARWRARMSTLVTGAGQRRGASRCPKVLLVLLVAVVQTTPAAGGINVAARR